MTHRDFTHILEILPTLSPEQLAMLRRKLEGRAAAAVPSSIVGHGLIGALRDDAELLDMAVEHAMKVREDRPWRLGSGELGPSRHRYSFVDRQGHRS